ncbi:hypothetical protein R1sor_022056 [Riccia sorocarpa]|uniref:Uncharacterized protein n=1 Tax=Riccia sorocarpa TaxID=122646 RepID=A0ABD3GLX8_9MARC
MATGVTVGLKPRNLKAEAQKGKEAMPSTPSESFNPVSPIPNDRDPQQSTPANPAPSRTTNRPPIKKKQQRKTRRGPPIACNPDGISAADIKEVFFNYVLPKHYFSRSTHPGELQINRQTVNMKTPEYIPVNDEDEPNRNRTPVATPNPGNPLETRCGILDIDKPEWLDHSPSHNEPRPETNEQNEATQQPAATNDEEQHVNEGNNEVISLDVEAYQRVVMPSPEYFLIERDELPDATETDIAVQDRTLQSF